MIKKIFIYGVSVFALLCGILLLFADPLTGFMLIAIAVFLVVYYRYDEKKKVQNSINTVQSENRETNNVNHPKVNTVTIKPSRKALKSYTSKVAGVSFNCSINKDFSRTEIIERLILGQSLNIKKYKYKKEPAILLIDPSTNLDVGNVPAKIAEEINENYNDKELEVFVKEAGTFFPDDDDDDSDRVIGYCKVRIFVLSDNT